jgi:hypothetical protein
MAQEIIFGEPTVPLAGIGPSVARANVRNDSKGRTQHGEANRHCTLPRLKWTFLYCPTVRVGWCTPGEDWRTRVRKLRSAMVEAIVISAKLHRSWAHECARSGSTI